MGHHGAQRGRAILLPRDAFREAVFARDGGRCVNCGSPAQDAHHILERRLFPDGGYYLDNGASVCGPCHMRAEQTLLSPERLRERAGVLSAILPPLWCPDWRYTKWGDQIIAGGLRTKGPLFADESVQRLLSRVLLDDGNPLLSLYVDAVSYPRTPHLPGSPGMTEDDRVIGDLSPLKAGEVVGAVKWDGESVTAYPDGSMHARSVDGASHPSQAWARRFAAEKGPLLPQGWRLCGEYLYAVHSIRYENLRSYFLAFSFWDESNRCLPWDDTVLYAAVLEVETVGEFYRGPFDQAAIHRAFLAIPGTHEGYVVRTVRGFPYAAFGSHVAKWVRVGHVDATRHHWSSWYEADHTVNGLARERAF